MANAAKIRRLNLNNYVVCSETDVTDGGLIITPQTDGDFQPPNLYYNRVDDPDAVIDIDGAVWTKGTKISQRGTREEYNERVEWWFNCAEADTLYKEEINRIYENAVRAGLSLDGEIIKAKNWLQTCSGGQRKVSVNQFLTRWLTNSANRILSYKKKW